MATPEGSELLLILVDVDRASWSALDAAAQALDEAAALQGSAIGGGSTSHQTQRHASFVEFSAALQLFIAAFCASSRHNQLAVLGYNGLEGGYLYPPLPGTSKSTPSIHSPSDPLRPAVVKRFVNAGLRRLRGYPSSSSSSSSLSSETTTLLTPVEALHAKSTPEPVLDDRLSTLGSCLTASLCYAHKHKQTTSTIVDSQKIRVRAIVFQVAPDQPSQYIAVTNAVCSAGRFGVPVDSVIVGKSPSVFLQQAALLTNAQHLKPEVSAGHFTALFQYLLVLLLPDAKTRGDFLLPPQSSVALRAHCFCHKQHKTMAFLCHVCLSIWCRPEKMCPTCKTVTGGGGGGLMEDKHRG